MPEMTSQQYLDGMNQLQELYKKYQKENEKIKEKNKSLKNIIIILYGCLTLLHNIMDTDNDCSLIAFNIIEGIKIYLNCIMNEEIFE